MTSLLVTSLPKFLKNDVSMAQIVKWDLGFGSKPKIA